MLRPVRSLCLKPNYPMSRLRSTRLTPPVTTGRSAEFNFTSRLVFGDLEKSLDRWKHGSVLFPPDMATEGPDSDA